MGGPMMPIQKLIADARELVAHIEKHNTRRTVGLQRRLDAVKRSVCAPPPKRRLRRSA